MRVWNFEKVPQITFLPVFRFRVFPKLQVGFLLSRSYWKASHFYESNRRKSHCCDLCVDFFMIWKFPNVVLDLILLYFSTFILIFVGNYRLHNLDQGLIQEIFNSRRILLKYSSIFWDKIPIAPKIAKCYHNWFTSVFNITLLRNNRFWFLPSRPHSVFLVVQEKSIGKVVGSDFWWTEFSKLSY